MRIVGIIGACLIFVGIAACLIILYVVSKREK